MNDILTGLQEIFRDVFDNDEIVLQESTCADDIEDWDSLAQMNLVAIIEKQFHVKFTVDEILAMKCVGNMIALIQQKIL